MWLVFGGEGQLGRSLGDVLGAEGLDHLRVDVRQCDLTDPAQVHDLVAELSPTVVVNAAAWTAVDDAEDHEAAAYAINCDGARHAAQAAHEVGARFFHVSTDYVFDGQSDTPYRVDQRPAPVGAYGRTKLAGEQAVESAGLARWHVLRTAWLYSPYGRNFAKTMVSRALAGAEVRVVDDQRGQPTSALDLARLMVQIDRVGAPSGLWHATNSGEATWYDFTVALYEATGADTTLVHPTDSASYPTRAVRPAYSVLDHSGFAGTGVSPMRHWRDALLEVIGDITEQVRHESQG